MSDAITLLEPQFSKAEWTVIVPVQGILPAKGADELKLVRVTLIEREKFFRARKRFPIGEHKEFFTVGNRSQLFEYPMFAVLRFSGMPDEIQKQCLRLVSDELEIFSTCRIGLKRAHSIPIGFAGQYPNASIAFAFVDPSSPQATRRESAIQGGLPLFLEFMGDIQRESESFFPRLLKILRKEIQVDSGWRDDLRRAAIFIGRSYNQYDIATAFLFQMIALETLLTRQGDRYSDDLPERIEALLGNSIEWQSLEGTDKFSDMYKRRCGFVHGGRSDLVGIDDLLFVDDIVYNVFRNIVSHTKLFRSKDDLVDFSRKVAAERLLGIKPKIRPESFSYISRKYSESDKKVLW